MGHNPAMSQTIHEVLGQLRASSLDARDQGDKFEALVAAFLRTDPEWTAKFDDVWTWTEWPGRAGRHDTGVDLVAKLRDSDKLAAIQCKFYGEGATVSKGAIDSFLSASSKTEFAARYIFDTAKSWSKNADDTLDGQLVPVQRVDLHHLDEANIDWSAYSWDTPEVLPSTGPKSLRPHQTKALQAVREGLTAGDRGKLIMACDDGGLCDLPVDRRRRPGPKGGGLAVREFDLIICDEAHRTTGTPSRDTDESAVRPVHHDAATSRPPSAST
jgi:predicted helicase